MRSIPRFAFISLAVLGSHAAWAADDLWTRSTLFDTPGGPKQELAAKGVDLGLDLTQFVQGLQNSGDGWPYGGKVDLRFRLDGQKLGTWAGFFVTGHVEYNYGSNANGDAQGLNIFPVNTALGYPSLNSSMFSLLFTQAFSPTTALTAGLFNMFDAASRRPLVGGGGIDTFWNLAVAAPITNITPAYIYGLSLNTRTDIGSFGLFIYDPRDAQNLNVISDIFSEGATYSATANFPVTIAELGGFQNLRVAYSTLDGIDLSLYPPSFTEPPALKDDRWYFQYSFEQFFQQDAKDPKIGWGLFGQLGYSDGNPNAFKEHWYLGLGGNNLMPERQLDRWGVVYFAYRLSNAFKEALPFIGQRIEPTKGAEIFYNWAVTPWFRLSADAQWVRPFNGDDNNYYLGLRAQLKFF